MGYREKERTRNMGRNSSKRNMGRRPCCEKEGLNRGAWSAKEDETLINYVETHGQGNWRHVPIKSGLNRCGKSCRLRWLNYLRPEIKRGNISIEEEDLILRLHKLLGNRWSLIAGRLPGRTDNEIKNYWNTKLSKRSNAQANNVGDSTQVQHMTGKSKVNEVPTASSGALLTDSHPPVIRTKAFRCTKVVIPWLPNNHDDRNQMAGDENILIPSCRGDGGSGTNQTSVAAWGSQDINYENNYSSDDQFLDDFDINDLLMSDVVLDSDFCYQSNELETMFKDIHYHGHGDQNGIDDQYVSCEDINTNGFFPLLSGCGDNETLGFGNALDQTAVLRSETWRDVTDFDRPFQPNDDQGLQELSALSSFLNSDGDDEHRSLE